MRYNYSEKEEIIKQRYEQCTQLHSEPPKGAGPKPEQEVVLLVKGTGPSLKLEASPSRAAPACEDGDGGAYRACCT